MNDINGDNSNDLIKSDSFEHKPNTYNYYYMDIDSDTKSESNDDESITFQEYIREYYAYFIALTVAVWITLFIICVHTQSNKKNKSNTNADINEFAEGHAFITDDTVLGEHTSNESINVSVINPDIQTPM